MTKLITIFDKDLNQRVFRLFYENEIVHKIDTSITISSSKSSIDVGENVILSGVLSDAGGNVLSGKNVRILKNNVLVDTVTTDSSGAYSKTISGLSAGTYHFHASFAGDDTYDNALSSTIDVNVLSHVYVVTLLSDKQSILSSESVSLSGTVTRDSEGYAGQSVRLFDGVTLVDTLTTDSNGDFSKTLSNLSVGTHRFFAQFDAYESSIVVVEVQDHDYAINISADNPIIQTGDTAIITATLTDSSNPVVGETLSYSLTNKGTVVGSGSTTTNSNGEISITYVGAGLGDIDVEVTYGTLLQETFVVEDCLKYYSLTDNTHESAFTIPSDVVSSYSSDGWNMSATNYSMVRLTDKLTNDCSVEFTLVDYNKLPNADTVIVYQYSNGETMPNQEIITSGDRDNFPLILGQRMNHNLIRGAKYKIEYTSSTIKVYENNILLASASNTVGFPTRFEWHMGSGGRYAVYKDLKVKAL